MSAESKKFPLFSVITVNLNNLDGLTRTSNSIEEQTFKDYEWIVIDGGSTDGSYDFLHEKRKLANKTGAPFSFSSQKDNGIYDAMNIGVERAKGRYVIFMNAGDCFSTPKILNLIAKYAAKKPDFIYGDSLETTDKKRKPVLKAARPHKDIMQGMFTHHQAMIYNRLKIRDWQMHYSLLYKIASDYDFTARYLRHAENIIYINQPLCLFETGGISQQSAFTGRREQFIIREKLEMVSPAYNVWLFLFQSVTWFIRSHFPMIYNLRSSSRTKAQ